MDNMIQISVGDLKEKLDLGYSIVKKNGNRGPFDMVYNIIQDMFILGYFPNEIMDYANDIWDKVLKHIQDAEQKEWEELLGNEVMDND